jgi:site-specific DNA recombinase
VRSANTALSKSQIRCAIYTRKSTDEGLEQEFNSLDSQREAAEAFIESQQQEGWVCLPERYDDGGFSGGTIERPALKKLIADIEGGQVDCIVVYKVDRLSRSLLDFARIMKTLERNGVSFVSVTQQFNTTHSMGRLTLNILLSFAQFEREIIAERTRDKMSAARRKGKWTGGMPVLGYDIVPQGGRLVVNEEEAAVVRSIYELYLENQSLLATVQELNRRGKKTKQWITKKGRKRGGNPFNKVSLYSLLTNILYLGKIDFQGEVYKAEHPAIVEEELWRRVQRLLRRNGGNGGKQVRNKYGALLKGLIYCVPCQAAMTHTYTVRNHNKRYRYFVCSRAQKQGWAICPTKSLPAAEIERFVVDRIRCIGTDPKLLAITVEQARAQHKKTIEKLEAERRALQSQLGRYHTEVHRIIKASPSEENATARLAHLQDRIQEAEQRAMQVREALDDMNRTMVYEQKLASAIGLFDPVWETLSSRGQSRVIHLLVEKIGYDGKEGAIQLTLRPTGIEALAAESSNGEISQ